MDFEGVLSGSSCICNVDLHVGYALQQSTADCYASEFPGDYSVLYCIFNVTVILLTAQFKTENLVLQKCMDS